jgi:hypothetical protein
MPKEEQPQTHENIEAQKLVDRIEKKVSAQRKNRSSKTPSRPPNQKANTPKRNLRIVKLTPIAIGVCERCNAQFKSSQPLEDDAEAEMRAAFDAHKCKLEDASQAAARIVKEATDRD